MNNTHRVCDVFVTIPVLGTVSRDESGAILKHGGKCRVHVYAVKRGRALTDGLMVGSTVFSGYTESPYRRKIKVIVPDGHSLVALRMGEDGQPLSWDSLPIDCDEGNAQLNSLDGMVTFEGSLRVGVANEHASYEAIRLSVEEHILKQMQPGGLLHKVMRMR